jgi:hypothetical protein
MQVMNERDDSRPLEGIIQLDDAYWGGERRGGKRGRGAAGKTSLTLPRQGFVVPDVGNGADCGESRSSFQRCWLPVSRILGAWHGCRESQQQSKTVGRG